ncbi:MAG: type II secretion system protein GspJ [Verrucomicrobiota bacterium]
MTSKRQTRSGFTLLEVMLATGMTVLLVGAMFGLLQAMLSASTVVADWQRNADRIQAWDNLFRHTLQGLESRARLVITRPGATSSSQLIYRIEIYNSPQSFALQPKFSTDVRVMLECRTRDDGNGVLLQLDYNEETETAATQEELPVVVLFDQLKSFELRFYDSRTQQWEEEWNSPSRRPNLIEMTMEDAKGEILKSVYWIPPGETTS